MTRFRISILLFFCLAAAQLPAQNRASQNRHEYYRDPVHFGFYLGVNRTNFQITPVQNWQAIAGDSLKTILSSPEVGFNLGIVSELRLHEYVTLRFVPAIAFGQRNRRSNRRSSISRSTSKCAPNASATSPRTCWRARNSRSTSLRRRT
jgi:hypothetical protein